MSDSIRTISQINPLIGGDIKDVMSKVADILDVVSEINLHDEIPEGFHDGFVLLMLMLSQTLRASQEFDDCRVKILSVRDEEVQS